MRIYLLPGLGADARIFEGQLAAFPEAEVPMWIRPTPEDNVETYARRLARNVMARESQTGPCMVVGLSFGGVLSQYFAEEIGAETCVVLSSAKTKSQFPCRYYPIYLLFKYAPPLAWVFILAIKLCVTCLLRFAPMFLRSARRSVLQQLRECDGRMQFYFVKMLMCWAYDLFDTAGTPAPPGRVFQVHGKRDHIIPCRGFTPDYLIPRGGHILCLTHARALNEILERIGAGNGKWKMQNDASGTQASFLDA